MRAEAMMWEADEIESDDAAHDRLRVVIADDVSAMRALLRRMLEESAAFDIVGEAGDGEEAVRLAGTLHPDLVLLDLAMPGMDGLSAIPGIRTRSPASHIVILSAIESGRGKDQALASGADAFIEKRMLSDSLAQRLVEACQVPLRQDREAGDEVGEEGRRAPVPQEIAKCSQQDPFRLAFDRAPIGMVLLDLEGRFQRVNKAFCALVGRPMAELVDTGIHAITHPGDVDRHAGIRQRLLRARPRSGSPAGRDDDAEPGYQAEHRFIRADGQLAWTLVTCSVLRADDGSPWRFLCHVVDVTERAVAEATNGRSAELRERYERELARANADLAQFATVAAHDLRSPLQVISGFAALLDQTHGQVPVERGREYLAFILKSATRMNALIDDLLAYAKVGADRREVVALSLEMVVDEVRSDLASELSASGGTIMCDSLPAVAGDPAQFVDLVHHLVANALKFVADGTAPRIRVSASRMLNAWCIEVLDNGIGIDPQHRSHIFGIFQRLHRNEYQGTGIGLAICKRIVEQRGGSIWVEENPGGGSRFRFTVPDVLGLVPSDGGTGEGAGVAHGRFEADPSAGSMAIGPRPSPVRIAIAAEVVASGVGASGSAAADVGTVEGLDVLLVEDDDDHARLVEETLAGSTDGTYRLRRARDLAGARAELQRQGADCILLDLFLPDGQGLESLSQLNTLEPLVPIVILTSLADELLGLKAVHEGAQDYLVKGTVDGPRLSRSLRHAVERKALQSRFAEQALHDPLTGLANRTLLLDRLRLELARTSRTGAGVAVFYLDVDGFKAINDRWGHAAGDEVLLRVAHRLSGMVRPGDTVSRIGGDEFVIVCGGVESDADLAQMEARMTEALGSPLLLGGGTELVTASIGVAVGRGSAEEPEAVIRRADEAMYEVKRRRWLPGTAKFLRVEAVADAPDRGDPPGVVGVDLDPFA